MSPTAAESRMGLWRDRRGAVGLELVLLLPLLLLLLFGLADLIAFVMLHQRAVAATRSVVDLVTRSATVTAAEIADYGRAANLVFAPGTSRVLPGRVHSVAFDASGGARILWSATLNGGAGGESAALATALSAARPGLPSVIVVQSTATYTPFFLSDVIGTVPITHSAVARPRRSLQITLNP